MTPQARNTRRLLRAVSKGFFALLFVVGGVLHFLFPAPYLRIMPPYLPWHRELVYLSGVVEAGLGVLLLFPRTQRLAAWGLIATLAAIFPANLHAALTSTTPNPAMPGVSPLAAWLRLPLQPLLILWAYRYTQPDPSDTSQNSRSP